MTTPRGSERNNVPHRKGGGWRFAVTKLVLIALFAIILGRLFQIQVLQSNEYREIAKRQYELQTELPASRGVVYDRNGNILISNSQFISFAVDPVILAENAHPLARKFSSVFGKPAGHYTQRIQAGRRFVWLERRVLPEYLEKINPKDWDGLIVIQEPTRLYHYGELARDVLGATNIDNVGISGIELQFDNRLRGKNGYMIMQRDGKMRSYPSIDYPRVEPVNGNSLVLTLDLSMQSIVEEELRRGIERNNAESGVAIMMNPKTGAILAMANYPSGTRNRAVTDMFEPGSVFKIVTASAALEHNIRTADDTFYAEGGVYRVQLPGNRVRIIRDTEKYEWLTLRQAMAYSSNIVMAKLSDEVGAERLYKTARDFGFGITTGIELPGEVRGELKRPVNWSGTTLHTMSFGYEVAVTPLQIAVAYSAIANGGIMMRPHIVERELDAHGRTVSETRPQQIRRVVGKATADTLLSFLEDVVRKGTARNAQLNGVRIAGKTGTARKFVDGRYSSADYTASFVGMFPVDDPQIVCVIMIDNPRHGGYYASGTSVPIFRNIAERIITTGLLRVPPPQPEFFANMQQHIRRVGGDQIVDEYTNPRVPDVRHYPLSVAREIITRSGYRVQVTGDGIVVSQEPSAGSRVEKSTPVKLVARGPADDRENVLIPDLVGLSIRSALNRAAAEGLSLDISGHGVVIQQSIRPGQQVPRGTLLRLHCRPRGSGTQVASH